MVRAGVGVHETAVRDPHRALPPPGALLVQNHQHVGTATVVVTWYAFADVHLSVFSVVHNDDLAHRAGCLERVTSAKLSQGAWFCNEM